MVETEPAEWIRWTVALILGIIGTLVCLVAWFVWREIRRIGRRLHDTNNVVDRHDKWITILREKAGIGRRDE